MYLAPRYLILLFYPDYRDWRAWKISRFRSHRRPYDQSEDEDLIEEVWFSYQPCRYRSPTTADYPGRASGCHPVAPVHSCVLCLTVDSSSQSLVSYHQTQADFFWFSLLLFVTLFSTYVGRDERVSKPSSGGQAESRFVSFRFEGFFEFFLLFDGVCFYASFLKLL